MTNRDYLRNLVVLGLPSLPEAEQMFTQLHKLVETIFNRAVCINHMKVATWEPGYPRAPWNPLSPCKKPCVYFNKGRMTLTN